MLGIKPFLLLINTHFIINNLTIIQINTYLIQLIEEISLLLLIWGESANLRHLPESLCYIYHKLYPISIYNKTNHIILYPGYYLDMIVSPCYNIISKTLLHNNSNNHNNISNNEEIVTENSIEMNYDDFNEFFWTSDCLKYDLISNDNDNDNEEDNEEEGRGDEEQATANANANDTSNDTANATVNGYQNM